MDKIGKLGSKYEGELAQQQWERAFRGVKGSGGSTPNPKSAGYFVTHAFHDKKMLVHGKSDVQPKLLEKEYRGNQDFVLLPGNMAVRITELHDSFTFLPAVGDSVRSSSLYESEHALYEPAKLILGSAPATSASAKSQEDPVQGNVNGEKSSNTPKLLVSTQIWLGDEKIDYPIYSNDLEAIRWLGDIVTTENIVRSFQNTANLIDKFAEIGMFIASLHPLVGAIMTGVELAQFARLLQSDEFRSQLTALVDDPTSYIEDLLVRMLEQFEPSNLFDAMMNGHFDTPSFLEKTKGKKPPKMTGGLNGRKMNRMFTRVRRVGAVAALKLESFQQKIQGPVRSAQEELATHPRVAALVSWAGENVNHLDDYKQIIDDHPIAGPIFEAYEAYQNNKSAESFEEFSGAVGDMQKRVAEAMTQMQNFSLPKTILPQDMIVAAMVELMLVLVKKTGRYGKIVYALGKVLTEGLESAGLYQPLIEMAGKLVKDSKGDPNIWWQTKIVPRLEEPLRRTMKDASTQLYNAFSTAPVIKTFFPRKGFPTGGSVTPEESDDGLFDDPRVASAVPEMEGKDIESVSIPYDVFKELPGSFFDSVKAHNKKKEEAKEQAFDVDDFEKRTEEQKLKERTETGQHGMEAAKAFKKASRHVAADGGPTIGSVTPPVGASTPGRSLPAALKSNTERGFGHDLSNVRLHQDRQTDVLTRSLGADALTSGKSYLHAI